MGFLYLLLVFSTLVGTLRYIYSNHFCNKALKIEADIHKFNGISFLAAIPLFLFPIREIHISLFTICAAVAYALLTIVGRIIFLKALASGPMSYTILFNSCGMIIPVMIGMIFWHEQASTVQILGMFMMICAFYFGANPKRNKTVTLKWFVLSVINMALAGLIGVVQKIHQTSAYKSEMSGLLIIAFILMFVVSAVLYFIERKKVTEESSFNLKSSVTLNGVIIGLCIGVVHKANLFLIGQLPSIIFFPISNGGVILLSGISAILFFREKLSKIQTAGYIIGILSICLISLAI